MPKSPDHFKNDAAMLVRPVDEAFQNELAEKIKAAMSAQAVACGKPMGFDSALQWVASDLVALVHRHEAELAKAQETIAELGRQLDEATTVSVNRLARIVALEDLEARENSICPMCANSWMHTHSPEEVMIFKNGRKGAAIERDQAIAALNEAQAERDQAKRDLAAAQATIQRRERELEEADRVIWGWFTGPQVSLEEHRRIYEAALGRQRARHSARVQQAEAKKEGE